VANQPKKDPIPELYYKIGEILKRLKIVEERIHSTAEKLQNLNDEIVELKKSLTKFKAQTNEEFEKIKKEIAEINSKIRVFERDLPRLARKNELEVLKKVFSLWDPLNFVSEKELEFILEDKFEEFKMKLLKELKKQNINIDASNLSVNYKVAKKPKIVREENENKRENQLNLPQNRIEGQMGNQVNNQLAFRKQPAEKFLIMKNDTNPIPTQPQIKNTSELTSFIKEDANKQKDEKQEVTNTQKINPIEVINKKQEKETKIEENTTSNLKERDISMNAENKRKPTKHLKLPWELIGQGEKQESTEKRNTETKSLNKTNIYESNETLGFLDIKKIKDKKKEELEEKFKEKIRKHYEEFKKDWVEF